jgi:hypothetical protein
MYTNQAYIGFKIPKQVASGKYYFTGSFTSVTNNLTGATISVGRVFSTNSSDGTFNSTFNANVSVGANATTQMSAVDPVSGKIYVCGAFTTFNGVASRGLIRLNTNGTIDRSYGTGFNGTVNYVYVTPDQKVLCVGSFTQYLGVAANRIVRINEDGTRDGTFNILGGLNNQGQGIDADATHYYVTGNFTQYRGGNSGYIAKIDRTTALRVGTFAGFNASFTLGCKVVGNDLYVGGDFFDRFNGVVVSGNFCKLNKTTTPMTPVASFTTNLGTGFNQRVSYFDLNDSGTSIYIPHSANILNGISVRRFVKVSSAGIYDPTYIAPSVVGLGNPRANLVNEIDNHIMGVGDFTLSLTPSQERIVAMNPTSGSPDGSIFNYNMGTGVVTMALYTA